ncbi:CLUMA_CG018366, isoform A [Clunio marinus]|uniref:CLUMA_CG018366, isoform A n=1 Tax=Clunio marinus TaxID=568069 RepID=A0A1J1IYX2_9DIPT|nr:CLUMA_CG018366, isoform A [Clunio marinus]
MSKLNIDKKKYRNLMQKRNRHLTLNNGSINITRNVFKRRKPFAMNKVGCVINSMGKKKSLKIIFASEYNNNPKSLGFTVNLSTLRNLLLKGNK